MPKIPDRYNRYSSYKKLKGIFYGIIGAALFSQGCFTKEKTEMFNNEEIKLFEVKNVSIEQVIHKLNHQYKVPACLETIPLIKWDDPVSITFSLKLQNTTLHQILDALTKIDKRYFWIEKENIINVIPEVFKNDSAYILNQKILKFAVKNVTRNEAIATLLSLPKIEKHDLILLPEGRLRSMDWKAPIFSLNLYNVTIREILNAIVKSEGNTYWVCFNIIKSDGTFEHHLGFWEWESSQLN